MKKTTLRSCSILAIALLPLLSSCRKDTAKAPAADNPATAKTVAETIHWDVLPEVPHGVKECSCSLSENATAFANRQYVYGDNVSAAFVQLDGMRRRLVAVKTEERGNHITKTFYNGFYWMTVDMEQVGQPPLEGDEVTQETATITITAKDGRSVTKTVVGECGC